MTAFFEDVILSEQSESKDLRPQITDMQTVNE